MRDYTYSGVRKLYSKKYDQILEHTILVLDDEDCFWRGLFEAFTFDYSLVGNDNCRKILIGDKLLDNDSMF